MLYSYKSYSLILESKKREKTINKWKEKIKKFINIPEVIDYCIEKTTGQNTTSGIQYSVWLANQLKKEITKDLKNRKWKDKYIEDYFKKGLKGSFIAGTSIAFPVQIQPIIDQLNGKINYILDWLKNPLRGDEKVDLSNLNLDTAFEKSEEWHNSLKATGKITDESGSILIEFDDGYYWIDLEKTSCRDEADAMGHCGTTNEGDTLFSLRDKNKEPHVTVALGLDDDENHSIIYQMKGKNNKKPNEKYHPYIYRLLADPEIDVVEFGKEYSIKDDFNLGDLNKDLFLKLYNYKSDLIWRSIENNYFLLDNILSKDFFDEETKKDFFEKSSNTTINLIRSLYHGYIKETDKIRQQLKDSIKNDKDFDLENNILVKFWLWQNNYITNEELTNNESDLSYKDDKIFIELSDSLFDDNIVTALFSEEGMYWEGGEWYDQELNYIWDKINDKNKKDIKKNMIGREYTINQENVEINNEMFLDLDKIKYNDEVYNIYDILQNNKDDEVYTAINTAINIAQESADQDEYYKEFKSVVVDVFGDYHIESNEKTGHQYYYFDFDIVIDEHVNNMLEYMEDDLKDYNEPRIDFEDNYTESLSTIFEEVYLWDNSIVSVNSDKFNYGINGNIDDAYMNERLSEDLYDI